MMKFSLATLRNKTGFLVGDQSGASVKERVKEDQQPVKSESNVASVAWAIAVAIGTIAWAVAVYLIEHDRQRAQVEIARLEMEAKKQRVSG